MGGGDAQRPVLRVNEPKKWVRAANGRTARPITLVVNICDCAHSTYMLNVHSHKGKANPVFYLVFFSIIGFVNHCSLMF